ncbi:MAG: TatD family hydrolase [Alphaproteobacteria bacterium]|jgi:TatD DNase family protein|nr:TatD family hydrolase [Alphaproteobacteria bacterium]
MIKERLIMIIDTHCHLDELTSVELKQVIDNAKAVGVEKMITIAAERSEFEISQKIAEENDSLYFAVGIHPEALEQDLEKVYNDLISFSKHPKCVAIGESGLDYSYKDICKESQKANFIKHIKASEDTGLPLVIHNRDSDEDMMRIMDKYHTGKSKVIIHCFSAGIELAKWAIEKGYYISISGIVTFKNGSNVRDAVCLCPIEQLLVETDSPYLAPVPYRGKKCEPAYVIETFKKVAMLKGVEEDALEKQLEDNFKNIFLKA